MENRHLFVSPIRQDLYKKKYKWEKKFFLSLMIIVPGNIWNYDQFFFETKRLGMKYQSL